MKRIVDTGHVYILYDLMTKDTTSWPDAATAERHVRGMGYSWSSTRHDRVTELDERYRLIRMATYSDVH